MEAKTKDLWVFVETKEDGSAKNVGIELLAPGRDIANKQGGSLVAPGGGLRRGQRRGGVRRPRRG